MIHLQAYAAVPVQTGLWIATFAFCDPIQMSFCGESRLNLPLFEKT